ncbi:helix-turn-helix domain-containing protein [Streptomyces sp. NPDC059506]|uniref:helix-turn-helix domain-containing protein n=1 Tax=Streptomyces sp. NPDC059506 TaxID=3347751 RepID=UPI003675004F
MALRTNISERQRRLGAELRRLRDKAGMTLGTAAAAAGFTAPHLSHIEAGRTAVATDRLIALTRAYGCRNAPYVDALVAMSEANGKGWWSSYRNRLPQTALNLAELEANAELVRNHESLFVPGLFQTESYMRAVFTSLRPGCSSEEIEEFTAFRLRRQTILDGDGAPTVHAVVHEAALHMHIGGPDVMEKQLLHLVALARRPGISIQIIPYRAGAYAAFSGAFLHLVPRVEELGTVLVDHPAQALYLGDEDHLKQYSEMFDKLVRHALPPIAPGEQSGTHKGKDSLGLLQHILYTL